MNDSSIWYGIKGPSLREKLEHDSLEYQNKISRQFDYEMSLAWNLLDYSYGLSCHYMWIMNAPQVVSLPKNFPILLAAFHKSIFSLANCLELTSKGFYGSARPLLRHAFEFLVIAKFCSISENSKVYEQWVNGDAFYFTNGVLNKIISPEISPLLILWSELNEMTHATNSSSQVGLDFPQIVDDVHVNLALTRVFCDWLSHILTKHIATPSVRYATERYTPVLDDFKLAKRKLSDVLRESRLQHSKSSIRLITCYRRAWIIKT